MGVLIQICSSKKNFEVTNFTWPQNFGGSKIQKIRILVKNWLFLKFWLGFKILQRQQRLRPRIFFWCFSYLFLVQKKKFEVTNFFWCQILEGQKMKKNKFWWKKFWFVHFLTLQNLASKEVGNFKKFRRTKNLYKNTQKKF